MNSNRRKKIRESIKLIEAASNILDDVLDDEQFSYDNMPEGLQASYRGSIMEDNINNLSDAISMLENIVIAIENL